MEGKRQLTELFIDYFYLDSNNLSHTHSLGDKIIDKDKTLLARTKEDRVIIYSLYSSDQITIPIEYINIFLGFMREEGDRLNSYTPKDNTEGFIFSFGLLIKSLFYGLSLGREFVVGLMKYRSRDFLELMRTKFKIELRNIEIENIGGKARC
jgi:hypothetical protein